MRITQAGLPAKMNSVELQAVTSPKVGTVGSSEVLTVTKYYCS